MAAIAVTGAVAARVAVDDSAIEAAAKVYWDAHARYWAVLDEPDHTDADSDAVYYPKMEAYDALMELPASGLKGLGIKTKAYRHEWFHHIADYMDDGDLDVLLADIERLARRTHS